MNGLSYILNEMKQDLERVKKDKDTNIHEFMEHFYDGELNTLERYIEFIQSTIDNTL
jgi:hypothetical protein